MLSQVLLKYKHRYWVGALLLARCILLFIFYIYTANGSGVAFVSVSLAVLVILVFLAATGSVYRNYYLTQFWSSPTFLILEYLQLELLYMRVY